MIKVEIQYFTFNEQPSAVTTYELNTFEDIEFMKPINADYDAAIVQVTFPHRTYKRNCDARNAGTTAHRMIIDEAIDCGLNNLLND